MANSDLPVNIYLLVALSFLSVLGLLYILDFIGGIKKLRDRKRIAALVSSDPAVRSVTLTPVSYLQVDVTTDIPEMEDKSDPSQAEIEETWNYAEAVMQKEDETWGRLFELERQVILGFVKENVDFRYTAYRK